LEHQHNTTTMEKEKAKDVVSLEEQPKHHYFFTSRTWLVPVDGSPWSTIGLFHALDLMHDGDTIVIAYFVKKNKGVDEEERLRKEAKHKGVLSYYGGLVKTFDENVDYKTELVYCDDPREAIVAKAEKEGAGIIVMGHRGRGPVASLLLGSVSSYVVQHAPCPVTVVRESEEQRQDRLEKERKVEAQAQEANRRHEEKKKHRAEIKRHRRKLRELNSADKAEPEAEAEKKEESS